MTTIPTDQLPASEVLAEAAADMRAYARGTDVRLAFLPAVAELLTTVAKTADYVRSPKDATYPPMTSGALTVARTWLSERLRMSTEIASAAHPSPTEPAEPASPVPPATTEADSAPEAVREAAARAAWTSPGTQRLWRDHQEDTYIALMLARPDFCAMVDETYRIAAAHVGDEVDSLTAHSTTLNRLGWRMAEALGQVPDGAEAVTGNPEEQLATLLRDLAVLAVIGRMYLNALDADPENEHLTLAAALGVTEVRDAVERAEAQSGAGGG